MSVALTISPRDIPLLPGGMLEILRLANDPNVSMAQIERCIGRDQAMAVRVLTVANSSYYGCSRRIDSLRGAVALLGTRQIQNIAAALAIAPAFESEHGPKLWEHAVAAALWTQKIVKQLGLPNIEYLFTTALMHDIGIVMLLTRATALELGCIEMARTDARSLQEIEHAQLGCNHADLGAQVCRAWNLPERVAKLIADNHGCPEGEAIDAPLAILALADHLAVVHGSAAFDGMPAREPTTEELAAIGMQPSALADLGRYAEAVAAEAAGLG